MKQKELNVSKLYGKRKKIMLATVFLGVIIVIIILLTYYGQNVGSFSIKLEDDLKNCQIFISTDKDFNWYTSRLEAESLKDASPTSKRFIKRNECLNSGTNIGFNRGYISYTFYMKNMGTESIDIQEMLKVDKSTENLEEVAWVWLIEDDEDYGVYHLKDSTIDENWGGYLDDYSDSKEFESREVVMSKTIKKFRPGDVKKFTVITWIDGIDPDFNDNYKDGLIRFNLSFSVYKEGKL